MQNKIEYILDIGSSSICLLAVNTFSGKPIIIAEENVLYDGFIDGEFLSEDLQTTLNTLISQMKSKMRKAINSVIVGVPADFCICVCKRISRNYASNHKIIEADVEDMYESNLSFGDSEQYDVISYSPMSRTLRSACASRSRNIRVLSSSSSAMRYSIALLVITELSISTRSCSVRPIVKLPKTSSKVCARAIMQLHMRATRSSLPESVSRLSRRRAIALLTTC